MVQYLHQLLITLKVVSILTSPLRYRFYRFNHWMIIILFSYLWTGIDFGSSLNPHSNSNHLCCLLLGIPYDLLRIHFFCSLQFEGFQDENRIESKTTKEKMEMWPGLSRCIRHIATFMCLKTNVARSISLHMRERNAVVMLPTSNDNFCRSTKRDAFLINHLSFVNFSSDMYMFRGVVMMMECYK